MEIDHPEVEYRDAGGFAKGKGLPWDASFHQALEVRDGFVALGLTPQPCSRIARYIEEFANPVRVDERSAYRMMRFRIDVRMLRTILRHLGDAVAFRPLLREMLSGSEFPQRHGHSRARDIQFQLYMAAVYRRAGFAVINEEPDISIDIGYRRFAIAVKRVRSAKKLIPRIKEGIEQIRRSGKRGWVALDLTMLAIDPEQLPVNQSSVDLRNIFEFYLKSRVQNLDEISQLMDGLDCVGV